MEYKVLALGDVASETGLQLLEKKLRAFKKEHDVRFTVVNGENISGSGLTRDHILFFLKQFQEFDYSQPQYQKRLIDTFINSIYVYPDEMTFNFNFGNESRTIKFEEMEAAKDGEVFARCAPCSTIKGLLF
mgnify:CR=1 FL=1